MANSLKEGVVGSKLVKYFEAYTFEPEVIEADFLNHADAITLDQVAYRLTFEDGSVSDWLITFEPGNSLNIINAEQFNVVL